MFLSFSLPLSTHYKNGSSKSPILVWIPTQVRFNLRSVVYAQWTIKVKNHVCSSPLFWIFIVRHFFSLKQCLLWFIKLKN